MMSDKLQIYSHVFEGCALTTIMYKSRPCWIAKDVGAAIGYTKNGSRLPDKIRTEWRDEFIDGLDVAMLTGAELNDLRRVLEVSTGAVETSVSKFAPSLLVMFESGLHMALAKTSKPIGKKLRRFLVDEVLPQVARDGSYSSDRQVMDGRIVEREQLERERLAIDREKLRHERYRLIQDFCDLHGLSPGIMPEAVTTLRVSAIEELTGRSMPALRPVAPPEMLWQSPTDIAKGLDVTAQLVGRVITRLDLRGAEGMSRAIINKSQHSDRTVTSYLYSPEAVELIRAAVLAQGMD